MNEFWDNVIRRIEAISVHQRHAEKGGVSNTAKSIYYRSAIILTCTVVEALVYYLLKEKTKGERCLTQKRDYKEIQSLSAEIGGTSDYFICRKEVKDIYIDGLDFVQLNQHLKKKKIVNEDQHDQLEYVRKVRNSLHLQSLGGKDTGYTKEKLEKVSRPLYFLISKLERELR